MHIKILIRNDFSDVTLANMKNDNIQYWQQWWEMQRVINYFQKCKITQLFREQYEYDVTKI